MTPAEVAERVAPDVDRLVFALNGRVGPRHGAALMEIADTIGLSSLAMLPHFEDWLLAGTLTRELATLRLRYLPPSDVLERLDELRSLGLVDEREGVLSATERLRPLLEALLAARASVGADLWTGHEQAIAAVVHIGRQVVDAAGSDHVVAVSHRSLPDPVHPYLRLEHRLFTLRYIRQHDHAAAWTQHDLSADVMGAFTTLWSGGPVERGSALDVLIERGLAASEQALTVEGRQLRDEIEAETNRRNGVVFAGLAEAETRALLEALQVLPDA